jgi:transglutaminase-like putative cysteine protease
LQVTLLKRAGVIVTAGQPLSVNIDSRVVFGPDPSDVTSIRPPGRMGEGDQYRVDSTVSNASVGRLRAAGTNYPAWTSAYLQLPADLPRQIAAKAREVTAGTDNAYDRANQIEQYLRTFAVDTKIPPAPARRDSVAYFLFDIGRGYFDYHASAMVVMLRTLGIPARMTVGYIIRPQDRIPNSDVYAVAEANSFAWPEVYFPGLGWVEFNPTPSEPRIARSGSDDQEFFGSGEEEFIEDDLFPGTDVPPVDPAAETLDDLRVEEESNVVANVILSVVLLFVALTAAGVFAFQYSWQHGLGGLPYPVQVWEKTMRLAKWARIRTLPQETPRELTSRLSRELSEVDDVRFLGEAYVRSRYGQKELAESETERLATVWKSVRNTLLARIFRWK